MILAFAHPCLVVPDLEGARTFYEEMFGFTVISEEGWPKSTEADAAVGLKDSSCRGYMMAGHNCYLELFEFDGVSAPEVDPENLLANAPGIRHLSFFVDDCRKEYDRFMSLGGSALGTEFGPKETGHAIYCRDPFGNIIELCEVPGPNEDPAWLPGVSSCGTFEGKV